MTTTGRIDPPKTLNPLWILSLFLGISELTVGLAVTQANGWIQGMLAIFAVTFPLAISVTFFVILFRKPWVLYAPRDYPENMPIGDFVEAMTARAARAVEVAADAAVASVEVVREELSREGTQPEKPIDWHAIEAQARLSVEANAIEVDVSAIKNNMRPVTILLGPTASAFEVLSDIWLLICDRVDPYTYGEEWILRSTSTGKTLGEPGSRELLLANSFGDQTSAADAGLVPGSRWLAEPIKRAPRRG